MKRLLLPIFVLLSFSANSQSWTQIAGKQRFGTAIGIPTKDTTAGLTADSSQILIRPADSSLYVKYKRTWQKVGAVSVDTTIISTRLWRQKGIDSVAALANTKLSGLSVISPLTTTGGVSPVLSMSSATSTSSGYLTSTDWNTFNNKQNAIVNPMTGTGTINYVPKFTSTSSIGNSQIFDNGTNVGIGTASPWEALSIPFNSKLSFGSSTYPLSISRSSAGNLVTTISDNYDVSNTRIDFVMRNGTANQNTPLSLLSSGNVGIGITSPTDKLHVVGSGLFTNSTDQALKIQTTGTGANNARLELITPSYSYTIQNLQSANALRFYDNNASLERMRIDNAGNVGIGTTSPAVLLHLAKTSAANQFWLQSTTGTNAAYMNFKNTGGNNYIGVDNSSGNGLFATGGAAYGFGMVTESAYPVIFGTNNTERMRIDASGNVGIGNTSPGQKLSITGGNILQTGSNDVSAIYHQTLTSASSGGGLWGVEGSTAGSLLSGTTPYATVISSTSSGTRLQFGTGGSIKATITSGGNVLIGTTTDNGTDKLQVNGSASIANATFNGTVAISNSTGIPANAGGSSLFFAGGFASPVSGRVFIGDGTGWKMNFSKRSGSVTTDLVTIQDNGDITASGTATAATIVKSGGTSSQALMADGSVQTLSSGTYTATLTNGSGTSGLTLNAASYQRIGNIVTVYFNVQGTCTANSFNQANMTIPFGNNFGSGTQAYGNAFSNIGQMLAYVSNLPSTTTVAISFQAPVSITTFQFRGSFQYQVQ